MDPWVTRVRTALVRSPGSDCRPFPQKAFLPKRKTLPCYFHPLPGFRCDAHAIVIREKCDQVRGPVSPHHSQTLLDDSLRKKEVLSLRGWNRELLTRGPQDSRNLFPEVLITKSRLVYAPFVHVQQNQIHGNRVPSRLDPDCLGEVVPCFLPFSFPPKMLSQVHVGRSTGQRSKFLVAGGDFTKSAFAIPLMKQHGGFANESPADKPFGECSLKGRHCFIILTQPEQKFSSITIGVWRIRKLVPNLLEGMQYRVHGLIPEGFESCSRLFPTGEGELDRFKVRRSFRILGAHDSGGRAGTIPPNERSAA